MPKPLINIKGNIIGNWKIIKRIKKEENRHTYWMCICLDCGVKSNKRLDQLNKNPPAICECKGIRSIKSTKHGMDGTPEYRAWAGFKSRCFNKKHKQYKDYGGRGIKVCIAIKRDFMIFFGLVGRRPTNKHSIDRINNDRHYSCGKCPQCKAMEWKMNLRWATKKQQMNNRRCSK